MAAPEEALARWARTEMELPPASMPSAAALRRLCLGSCAPIWDFVTRHVRHPRAVKKIRGNLLWYQYLKETEGAGPAPRAESLRGGVARLRQEVEVLGEALGRAQEAVLKLEAELEAELCQRGAELRRALELRLLGEEVARAGQRLQEGRGLLQPPPRQEGAGPELAAAVAVGMEPEVLVSVRAACRLRAEALEELLEPRPQDETEKLMEEANRRWLWAAEAVLSRHPPARVLWALEQLALESTRKWDVELKAGPAPGPTPGSTLNPEAPPTVRSLIQECWGAVGGLWGRVPPLAARLPPLRSRLRLLSRRLAQRLGGDPKKLQAARLALEAAALGGVRRALLRGVQELRGAPRGGTPKPFLGERLRSQGLRLFRRRRRLRALGGATGQLKGRLRPLQAQVRGVARAGLSVAPPTLAEVGERLRPLLGALGGVGERLPRPAPDPLLPVCRALGLPAYQAQQGALSRAVSLRQELRELRRGAGPGEGAWPEPPRPPAVGVANPELLPALRLVAAQCRRRIEDWPHLQALVSQWWEQPAQWTLAPPPGGVAFSHWLQRWTRAAQALPLPRPLALAPPTQPEKRRGQEEPRP